MEGAILAGKALADDLGVVVDEDGHQDFLSCNNVSLCLSADRFDRRSVDKITTGMAISPNEPINKAPIRPRNSPPSMQ
jgi:hypothetical protein